MKFLLVLCAGAACACAQQSPDGGLAVRVSDPSGAAVPNAAVRAVCGNRQYAGVTGEGGEHVFASIPAGDCSIAVDAPGLRASAPLAAPVRPGRTAVVRVALSVDPLVERVTVTAKAPPLEGAPEHRASNIREVLEIREVRESSARDAGEALARLDGLWRIRKAGVANDVILRGFQQDNINVLIDGVRIHGACPNKMDPAAFHVDFAEIDHIEVSKGVFDIANQGSLGGTVNVVNKSPSGGLRITPNFSAGSFGYLNPSLTASYSSERAFALAGVSRRQSWPYIDGAGRPFTDYANYRGIGSDSSAFDATTGWLKLGASPGQDQRLELAYTRQQGGRTLYPYLQMDAVYDNADRLSASYSARIVRAQAYFTRVRHWMTDEYRVTSNAAPRGFGMATFAGTRMLGARVDAESGGFSAGVETYRRYWNAVNTMRMAGIYADQPSMPGVAMTVGGAYAQYRRALGMRLRIEAGARLDAAASDARTAALNTDLYWAYNATRSTSARDAAPSAHAAATYSLFPGVDVFAGIGSTVRLPDPEERFFLLRRSGSDWVGDPQLQSTRNTEADLGLNIRRGRFTFRPTVFRGSLDNFITVHNQPRRNAVAGIMNAMARSYANVAAEMYGGELSYGVMLSRSLLYSGGVSYVRGTKTPRPDLLIFSRNIAEIPPLKARNSLRVGTRAFFAEVEAIAVGAQNRVDRDLRESRTPGYAVANARAGLHARGWNLAVGMDNLLDRYYYEHASYQRDPFRLGTVVPEPGRALFATVSREF